MKSWKDRFIVFFASTLVSVLFRLLRATWRLEEEPLPEHTQKRIEAGQPVVFAHFHEDEWALLGFYALRKMVVLVSHSRDGEIMKRFLSGLGYAVARGSSSRGPVGGYLALHRAVEQADRKTVSLAVDGPRGPRRKAKKGVVKLALDFDAPVVAGGVSADRAWVFKRSWSQALLPKPFARVRLAYAPVTEAGELREISEREDSAAAAAFLETRLLESKKRVAKELPLKS